MAPSQPRLSLLVNQIQRMDDTSDPEEQRQDDINEDFCNGALHDDHRNRWDEDGYLQ